MGLFAPYSKELVAVASEFYDKNQWIVFIGFFLFCPGLSLFLWHKFSPGIAILICGLRANLFFGYAVWIDIVSNDDVYDSGGLGILGMFLLFWARGFVAVITAAVMAMVTVVIAPPRNERQVLAQAE